VQAGDTARGSPDARWAPILEVERSAASGPDAKPEVPMVVHPKLASLAVGSGATAPFAAAPNPSASALLPHRDAVRVAGETT
jgi:hypothetical protein